ncbi:MAG: hypothetical protein K2W86_13560 [Sphingomonas sp.]|nr:hypothetical protein [Sphingomonas sp.]
MREAAMGEKKSKSGKKNKPGKIPKTIAGVKIPKDLRKSGEALIATANSPVGRELIMTGVAAMIGAAATRMRSTMAAPAAPHSPQPEPIITAFGDDPHAAGAQAARQIIDAIGTITRAATRPPSEDKTTH